MTRVCAVVTALALVVGARLADAPTGCGDAFVTEIRGGAAVCIHASEPPPHGVDLHAPPSLHALEARGARVASSEELAGEGTGSVGSGSNIACIGDGIGGKRIQAVYARASDEPDRFADVAPLIRGYAADADYQINVSAGASGEGRRVRYVTDPACDLQIADVVMSPTGDDTFSNTRAELRARGLDRADRHYLVWVDAAVGICGLGEMFRDDRPGTDNRNEGGPMYARVDAPCWGYAEAHELLHTLGAVQDSAPHSTGAGHCVDENDSLCYVDTSGEPMTEACTTMPGWTIDCGLDDYFSATPAAGSYLAQRWNTASSSYLQPAAAPPPPPKIALNAPRGMFPGNAHAVRASVDVPGDRSYRVTWASSRADCGFFKRRGVRNRFFCPVTAAGSVEVTARVSDSLGMRSAATETVALRRPAFRRDTTLRLRVSDARIREGGRARLRGRLVDAVSGRPVIRMPVVVYAARRGGGWERIDLLRTTRAGRVSKRVSPSRTSSYVLLSGYTSTWASDQSRTVSVVVV